jgi:hypothetical protein
VQRQLAEAVVLDQDKQAEFATVGHAISVRLAEAHTLLDLLLPGHDAAVLPLGRWARLPAVGPAPSWPPSTNTSTY